MTSPTLTSAEQRRAALEGELARHSHGRVPGELRRRQLLELATQLFTERGYAAASMDELAARAGVSKPVIYSQFGSKEGLLVAAIEALGIELNEAVAAAISAEREPEQLLRAGSLAFFRIVGERHATWSMVFGATRSLDDRSRPGEEKIAEIRTRQDALVSAVILASARRLGGEPDPLEVGALTRGLNGVYEGMVEWWETHSAIEPERLTEWVVGLVLPGLIAMADREAAGPGR